MGRSVDSITTLSRARKKREYSFSLHRMPSLPGGSFRETISSRVLLKRAYDVRNTHVFRHRKLVPAAVKEGVARREDYIHPLYRSTRGVPPCKLSHAHLITGNTSPTYNPLERETDPVRLSPLCSQPLMELSLRIPVDVLTVGGRDRAIARQAFSRRSR